MIALTTNISDSFSIASHPAGRLGSASDGSLGCSSSLTSVETGIYDGYSLGGVQSKGYIDATAYGLQATPGTGAITVGQYVLAAAPAAIQVKETSAPRCALSAPPTKRPLLRPPSRRVLFPGPVGTGAVGTAIVIELL